MTEQLEQNPLAKEKPYPQKALLLVQNLGRQLEDTWIWRNISFEAYPSERLAIVGPSGAGKTLLLRAIAGLDPVQEGEIVFEEQHLESWFMPHYRTQIMYLHQRPTLLEGTVEDNIQKGYLFTIHRDKIYNREKIVSYLKLLGRTANFLTQSSAYLSGGEAQIVALLRALQFSPSILLLDEPTASLDSKATENIEALITSWHAESPQRIYILISHDPAQIERMTDRQIIL
ncbi:MAG: ATP-binding cassette domain-containing protein [Okeania sp. SIO3B5]|uniref:ABC transporter ATP-binding protein n=1 Tax=Okeania sp. SIO3B5 TaxID=2607811 RepID=UPI0013FEBEEE|nr:ATP-binding cassette domain-containing protein [Okeania sp. SIO3B5]NEO52607.1 ATP-binding cassette domain-containing protein [Okeania sp. SIO3B5]